MKNFLCFKDSCLMRLSNNCPVKILVLIFLLKFVTILRKFAENNANIFMFNFFSSMIDIQSTKEGIVYEKD